MNEILTNKLKLQVAIEIYKREESAPINSYDWYRRCALRSNSISIGEIAIPARKIGTTWYVDEALFQKAINSHRQKIALKKEISCKHKRGIITGKDGETVLIEGGGYYIKRGFRFEWSDYERARKKSDGTWYCNRCSIAAKETDNKIICPACHASINI